MSEGNTTLVRFDDRLMTVLSQPAEDRHDVAVRWRQLVDLVARAGSNSESPAVADALRVIREEAPRVEESLRAAAARAVAALPLPLGLLEYFTSDSLTVSAPVLAAASLDVRQWGALRAVANEETRAFIATLHPDVISDLRVPRVVDDRALESSPESGEYVPPSLHHVVERIEERRRLRAGQPPGTADQPSIPPALFRWECGPSGEIAWVEGAPRGALIGRSIAKPAETEDDRIDRDVIRAFNVRAPFRDGSLKVGAGGPVSGEWKISGIPAFDPADGRFAGYRGVALRDSPAPAPARETESIPEILADPASLRELVHEIKTPLNAIIGFAEIIEGQYLGPADRGYRNKAFEIVRQARLLLAAIDDLDFAAKLHSAAAGAVERVDLATLLAREAAQLRERAARKGFTLNVVAGRFDVPANVSPELADRLLLRLFDAVADHCDPGETINIRVELADRGARVEISRPNAWRGLTNTELFGIRSQGGEGSFMLRLARGLAQIAGGDVVAERDWLALVFRPG